MNRASLSYIFTRIFTWLVAGLVALTLTATAVSRTEKVLYSFGGRHGARPLPALLPDGDGGFFGGTSFGGHFGDGTVFHLTPGQNEFSETVLHSFNYDDG